jgi:hypothetical protein
MSNQSEQGNDAYKAGKMHRPSLSEKQVAANPAGQSESQEKPLETPVKGKPDLGKNSPVDPQAFDSAKKDPSVDKHTHPEDLNKGGK